MRKHKHFLVVFCRAHIQYVLLITAELQTRDYIDWRWPLSCVHSFMIVFSAQLAVHPLFTLSTSSTRVSNAPSTPSPSRLVSEIKLAVHYSNKSPLSHFLWQEFPESCLRVCTRVMSRSVRHEFSGDGCLSTSTEYQQVNLPAAHSWAALSSFQHMEPTV
jgi:hypothetical protein